MATTPGTALAAKSGTVPSGGGKVAGVAAPATSGSLALAGCVPGATGTAKWSPGAFELNVSIPSMAGQPVGLVARYTTGLGIQRVKTTISLDAVGRASVKYGVADGVPTSGSPDRIDVTDLTAAATQLLATDAAGCPVVL